MKLEMKKKLFQTKIYMLVTLVTFPALYWSSAAEIIHPFKNVHSYEDFLHATLYKIHDIALYTMTHLEETHYPSFSSPTQLGETQESLIMDLTDYMFWLVTFLDVEALQNLVQHYPMINSMNVQPLKWGGHSLLTYLMQTGQGARMIHVLSLLTKHGADPARFQRYTGNTVLMYTSSKNNVQLTKYFSEFDTYASSMLYVTSTNESTALHYAIEAGANDAANILMKSRTLVNQKNDMGNTPLHRAVAGNNHPLVKQLIKAGAYPVILNTFHEDPVIKAFETGNQLIIFTLLESYFYTTGIMRYKNKVRSRITRIHQAFSKHFPEKYVQHLLEPEFKSNDTLLCLIRDSQRRNIISMAINHQYYTVLGKLLDHFKDAYERKLPLWQHCNVHEPCSDNIYPLERYVRTFDGRTQSADNLRKLMNMIVPVDGTSALMHAIRHKEAELVLSNFIPFGVKDVLLSDLQLTAHEIGAESWGHNALTLSSEVAKGASAEVSRRLMNLMTLGLGDNLTEMTHAFSQSLSTASSLKDAALIQNIARQDAPAIQLWYCTFQHMQPLEVMDATFVTKNLPLTFPGFSPHIPCSPINHYVKLALESLQKKRIPQMDIIKALMRIPSVDAHSDRSILKALRDLGRTPIAENVMAY